MEILFIWIFDYKNIKKQGFNFSSEYIFNVQKKDDKGYILNVSRNTRFIANFFEKNNILNVTAIIGQNGTGKSNILSFINTSFPKGYSSIQSQAIIVYRIKEDNERKIIMLPNNNIKIDVDNKDNDFEIVYYPFDMPKEAEGVNGHDYSIAEYVYYSNIFDLKPEEINVEGIYNLSTLGMLKSDTSEQDQKQLLINGGSYDNYRANEIRRNIQFLLSDYTHLLNDFPLPEDLYIEILDNDFKYLQKERNPDVHKLLSFFKKELSTYKKDSNELFLSNLYISVFINFLTTDREFSSMGGFISDIKFTTNDKIKNYIYNFFENLPNIKYKDSTLKQPIPIANHDNKSKMAIKFFNYIEKLLAKKSFTVLKGRNLNTSTIKYSIKEGALEELTLFLKMYMNLKGLTEFIDFNWRNLSSGEQSLFTLISRFYHLKHHQIQHEDIKKNLVILIDEGDIYFHPAWQKKFFQTTINYLCELFINHNLQFIFTSNTPFITSDLPKSNIIFIEKISKKKIKVHSANNDRAETFGGNIHTLFADSFYMEGALIGEFAKDKINNIIKYLKGKSKQKREDYKETIDIIGEPVLKRKLQEMWFDKFGVDEEIKELQKRIEELKQSKK